MNDSKKPSVTEQNRKLREQLREANKKIEEQSQFIERLCKTVGYDRLANNWDKKKYSNEWVAEWLQRIKEFMNTNLDKPITWIFRNEAIQITEAVIMQLAIIGKYGIKLPIDPRPGDIASYDMRTKSQWMKEYPPCVICGEARITHQCHIIPRANGGKYHSDNLLDMCPLHHHLFDHGRLTKEEWGKLENALEGKMGSAIQYINTVQLNLQKYFWHEIPNAVYPDFSNKKWARNDR